MATLNEIAYDFLEMIRKNISDDEHIDIRQVKYWIHNQRALWLNRKLKKFSQITDKLSQSLGCVDMEIVDRSTCPVETPIGCYILRSKKEIPATITIGNKLAITRVGPLDLIMPAYSFVNYKRVKFSGNGRFNNETTFAFLYESRMYLFGKKSSNYTNLIDCINIRGVFEDPTEATKFKNPDGSNCYSDDKNYPIDRSILDYMLDMIVNNRLKIKSNPQTDSSNNSNSDPIQNG